MRGVDVIIPCFNYGHFLQACAESVLNQQGVTVRALIIDNASTDDTADIAHELALRDPRVKYRRHAVNEGHVASFNEGLDWATAEHTVLLPADDLLAPGALARAVRVLESHPEAGMCFGEHLTCRGDAQFSQSSPSNADQTWRVYSSAEFIEMTCAERDCIPQMCTVVMRTEVQQRLGRYRTELPHACDMDMWLRAATHGPIGKVNSVQGLLRQHQHNMSRQYYADHGFPNLEQRRLVFRLFFDEHRERVDGSRRLEIRVMRGLAAESLWIASRVFEEGDRATYERYLHFARDSYPDLVSLPQWSRLRWQRLAGRRLWAVLRRMRDGLRRRTSRRVLPGD